MAGDRDNLRQRAIEFLGIAVAYFALAKLGLALALINPSVSAIWPPTGFALAIAILAGSRAGPPIFLAAFLANATTAGSLYTSLAIALGNTAEALLGGYLIRRWSKGPRTFDSPTGVARFALLGAAAATLISATVGVRALSMAGYVNRADLGSVWITWWLGDVAGALVVAPAIVLWAPSCLPSFTRKDLMDTVLICSAAIAAGVMAFGPFIKASSSGTNALAFLAILPLLWAALRGSQRDTATVSVILSCFAVWGTLSGHGPFAQAELNGSFLFLVAFMASAAFPSLALSAGVSERRRALAALRDSEARLRTLTDRLPNAAVYQVIVDGERWHYSYISRGIEKIRGVSVDSVLADPMLLHRQVLPQYLPALEVADAEATGNFAPFEFEFEVRLPGGEVRWLQVSSAPRRLRDGRTVWDGVQLDITERKRADERQLLMAREMDHRAKNLLAVVQSILNLSRANDIDTFVETVKGRVMAMARAHGLLSSSRWEGADLGRLVGEELEPHRTNPGRVVISGPPATLAPTACQPLALALHELATNAAKFGALSAPTGCVTVAWAIGSDGLTLTWREFGGPRIEAPPTRKGFGSTVLIGSIEQQLRGHVAMDWRPEGLNVTLFVPRQELAGTAPAPATAEPERHETSGLIGRRVLVVEDETLVAMDIAAALQQAGCEVAGPAATLAQALQLAEAGQLDAAVLDRNLRGELSDAAARRLRQRGVPFAIVTGYADAGLPAEFADAPWLAKPFKPDELTACVGRLVAPGRAPLSHK